MTAEVSVRRTTTPGCEEAPEVQRLGRFRISRRTPIVQSPLWTRVKRRREFSANVAVWSVARHDSASILRLHPQAEFRQGSWWLVTAISPFGDESEYPVVRALIAGGRVRALAGWIGAAGE